MSKLINKIINFSINNKKIMEAFEEMESYLKEGKYNVSDQLTCFYLEDEITETRYNSLFKNNTINKSYLIIMKIYKVLHLKYKFISVTKQSNKLNFQGTLYLASTGESIGNAKIFNFNKKQVLSKYVNKQDYYKKIDDFSHFNKHFEIPNIIHKEKENLVIIEEFVEFHGTNNLNENNYNHIFNYLCSTYYNYFQDESKFVKNKMRTAQDLINVIKIDDVKLFLSDNINQRLKSTSIPFLKLHGDLWIENILVSKNDKRIFVIDWEHSDSFFVFYDLFWYFQNQAIYFNDYSYMDNYIMGEYDNYIKKTMLLFNIIFDTKLRMDYFFIFIANVFSSRLIDKDVRTNQVFLSNITGLVNRYMK